MPVSVTVTALIVRPAARPSAVGRSAPSVGRGVRRGERLRACAVRRPRALLDRLGAQERDRARERAAADVRGQHGVADAGNREHLRARVLRGRAAGVLERRAQVGAAGEHEHGNVRAGVGHAVRAWRRRPVGAQRGQRAAGHGLRAERREARGALGDERGERVGAARDRRLRRPRQPSLDAGRGQQPGDVDRVAVALVGGTDRRRCSSGAASPSASEAIAAGRPARRYGIEVAGGERGVEVAFTHRAGLDAASSDRPAARARRRPAGARRRPRAPLRGHAPWRGRARGSRPRAARGGARACAAGRSRRGRRPARASRGSTPPSAPGSGARTRPRPWRRRRRRAA